VHEPKPGTTGSGEPDESGHPDTGWRALAAGFAHLRRTPRLLVIVVGLAVALSVIGVFDSLLFAVVEHGLHRPPEFFGVLMSAQGAGSIIGGVTAVRLMNRAGPVRAAGCGLLIMTVGSVPFLFGSVTLVLVGSALAGIGIPWAFVAMATTRQKLTPNHLQGRTASATGLALQLPQLFSTGVGAAVVALVDYRLLTVIAASVIGLAGLWLVNRARASASGPARTAAEESPEESPEEFPEESAPAPSIG
jgi:MFS family permease